MSLDSQKPVFSTLSPKSKKLAAALGLILGSTVVALNQSGCGLDVRGTYDGPLQDPDAGTEGGGQGGEGGTDGGDNPDVIFPVEDSSVNTDSGDFPDGALDAKADVDAAKDADVGPDADAGKDAEAGLDASMDADADVGKDADVGLDASMDADADVGVDAAPDADASVDAGPDADAGCTDIPVTFKNMPEYVLRVYSGSCNPAAVTYSSLGSFSGAETTLCLKTGDIAIVQVHDNPDLNAVEFDTTALPVAVKKVSFGVTTPITESEADAYCPDSAGWSTLNVSADDKNLAPNAYKYEGGAGVKSNGYKIVF
jgi:hypothetical protein